MNLAVAYSEAAMSSNDASLGLNVQTLEFVSAILVLITAIMSLLFFFRQKDNNNIKSQNEVLSKENASMLKRISTLEGFCRTVSSVEFSDTDLFIVGARGHGKTSLVASLVEQWQDISRISATPVHFVRYQWISPAYSRKSFIDEQIGVSRVLHKKARLNIFDFAGEDHSFPKALEEIEKSERFMILFVVSSEIDSDSDVARYFNVSRLANLKRSIGKAGGENLLTVLVFSKHDLGDHHNTLEPDDIPAAVQQRFARIIENIETTFDNYSHLSVSSHNGYGVLFLVRQILGTIVDEKGLPL